MIKAEAIVCRFCGRDVDPVAIAEQDDELLENEAQDVDEKQEAPVNNEYQQAKEVNTTSQKPKEFSGYIIIILIVVSIGIIMVLRR